MLRNIIFSFDFCHFKDVFDKIGADDDVTCMMTSFLIHIALIKICKFLKLRYSIRVIHKILEYCNIIFIISFNSR